MNSLHCLVGFFLWSQLCTYIYFLFLVTNSVGKFYFIKNLNNNNNNNIIIIIIFLGLQIVYIHIVFFWVTVMYKN
jgi:hypothetical protein